MTIDFSRIAAVVRQMAAIAAVVIGSLSDLNLPVSVRTVLVAAGGVLLTVEHLVAALPNTTTPPHPVTGVSTSANTTLAAPKGNLGSPA